MGRQYLILAVTLGSGLLMGAFLDVYQSVVHRARLRRLRLWVADFFLWLFLTVIAFIILFQLNDGEIHFYIFGGLALGILTYRRFLKRHLFGPAASKRKKS